jgi:hypothetical protein
VTPPVTQGRDAWSVPDIEALRPLAPRRSRWADVLLHRRRLVTAAVAFPLVLWAARTDGTSAGGPVRRPVCSSSSSGPPSAPHCVFLAAAALVLGASACGPARR